MAEPSRDLHHIDEFRNGLGNVALCPACDANCNGIVLVNEVTKAIISMGRGCPGYPPLPAQSLLQGQEEVPPILFIKSRSWIKGQPRRSIGDIDDRRDNVSRLTGMCRMPQFFTIPGASVGLILVIHSLVF